MSTYWACRIKGGTFQATVLSGTTPYPAVLCGLIDKSAGGELLKYVCGILCKRAESRLPVGE